ncbi:hypothetical protein Bbelb_204010 [Branchiostoma belcheri]|nr:hypothetical protein Bbelb_204010 [Branchiostoma belcheri]
MLRPHQVRSPQGEVISASLAESLISHLQQARCEETPQSQVLPDLKLPLCHVSGIASTSGQTPDLYTIHLQSLWQVCRHSRPVIPGFRWRRMAKWLRRADTRSTGIPG